MPDAIAIRSVKRLETRAFHTPTNLIGMRSRAETDIRAPRANRHRVVRTTPVTAIVGKDLAVETAS